MPKMKINSVVLKKNKLVKGVNKKIEKTPEKGKNINLSTLKIESFKIDKNFKKYDFVDLKHLQTINRLKQHKSILNGIGIKNFNDLGDVRLKGKISPSIGVFYPSLIKKSSPKTKSNINLGITKLKFKTINAKVISEKTLKATKVRSNSTIKILPSIASNPSYGMIAMSIFPVGQSYILASTLRLDSYTDIILNSDITDLIIIADQIITDTSNINITWNQPTMNPVPLHGDPRGVGMGQTGINGVKGNKGTNGRFAPNVEIWTLNPIRDTSNSLVTNPLVVNIQGQNGSNGGNGQNGGNGGVGKNGDDGVGNFINCKSGPKSGKNGGTGGNAGHGGEGGNGGDGGDLNIYTLSTHLSSFSNTILLNNGGVDGLGGNPGSPGQGGAGGHVGAAPKMCANTNWTRRGRVKGAKGVRGARGVRGNVGAVGLNGNLIQLNPITTALYNQTLNNPGIIDYTPKKNLVGSNMSIYGVNFSSTDTVSIENASVPPTFNNTVPNQTHTITIPDIEGGWKDIEIVNGSSNTSNIVRSYILASIQSLSHQRIKPGQRLTITGTGFSPNCFVYLNNQKMTNYTYVDKNTIEVVIERPNAIMRNPDGEAVSLKIIDSYNNQSNTVSLTLDTYRVFTIGDSIMAGQGHDEADMFSSLLENHIQSLNPEIGVYGTNIAHSGATIEYESLTGRANDDKEIPRSEPSIKAQLNSIISNNAIVNNNVELIVLDGGINDMELATFLQPEILPIPRQNRLNLIRDLAYTYSFEKMSELLSKIATTFPNTKVIVTGYYQVISNESRFLRLVSTYIGGYVAGVAGTVLSNVAFDSVVQQCKHAANELNRNLQDAVNATNSNFNTTNFKFVNPDFDKSNALFASNKFLWGFDIIGTVEDPLQYRRRQICGNEDNVWFCKMASVGHPNDKGIIQYFNKIKGIL